MAVGSFGNAQRHLPWLDLANQQTKNFIADFPFVAHDLATALALNDRPSEAVVFLEALRASSAEEDATILLELGRCYVILNEQPAAEECLLAAIEADRDNIDARIELANIYENAKEDEEALILAAEAMALRGAQGEHPAAGIPIAHSSSPSVPNRPSHMFQDTGQSHSLKPVRSLRSHAQSLVPRRYRPKRLAGPLRRRQDEQARAMKLSQQYEVVRDLKRKISAGHEELLPVWMTSSQELVDDFRSLKKFYSWERYLHFLGSRGALDQRGPENSDTELLRMYERLTKCKFYSINGKFNGDGPAG